MWYVKSSSSEDVHQILGQTFEINHKFRILHASLLSSLSITEDVHISAFETARNEYAELRRTEASIVFVRAATF